MPLSDSLAKLEELRRAVETVNKDRYSSSEEISSLARRIPELYGEVEDVYQRFAGQRGVVVEDGKHRNTFSNYFEAGYLSGRTFHANEGYKELVKVIGKVRQAVAGTTEPATSPSVPSPVQILGRFRACCQFLKTPVSSEEDVQDIIWIMLRAHFDRLDREDTLPRFGVKRYSPDFGIPDLKLLIEVKFIGSATKPASIQEEILADIPGYLQVNSQFKSVVVVVYDAAHKIRDFEKFVSDLRSVPGIAEVLVIPGIGAV